MTDIKRLALLCLLTAAGIGTADAHHSFATFDMTRTIALKGTVHSFEWSNPHTWVWLDVTNAQGTTVTWGLEGAAPGELSRHGWTKHSLNPGDKISVDIHPLKTGQNGGSFSKIVFDDGRELGAGGPGSGAGLPGEGPGAAAPPAPTH